MTDQRVAGRDRSGRRCAPRWRRLVAPAALLVALGAVASCADNPSPEPLAEESASPSATPSPSASPSGPPTLPPEARGTSKKAAIAFVEYVIDVLNYSAASLDTRSFGRLSTDGCDACAAIQSTTKEIRSNGGLIVGGAWQVLQAHALTGGSNAFRQVQAVVHYAPQKVIKSEGARPVHYPGGRTVYTFDVERAPDGWAVGAIRGVQQ